MKTIYLKPSSPATPKPPTYTYLASPQLAALSEKKCRSLCYLLTSSGKASEEGIVWAFLFWMLQQGDDTLMVK